MAVNQPRRAGGNGHVGKDGEHQPGPDRCAVDGGDDRLAAIDQIVDHVACFLPHAHAGVEIRDHIVDQVEIAAGRECLAGAGQQDRIDAPIGIDGAPDLGEVRVHVRVGGVELVRSIHDHTQDPRMWPIDQQARKLRIALIHGRPPLLSHARA